MQSNFNYIYQYFLISLIKCWCPEIRLHIFWVKLSSDVESWVVFSLFNFKLKFKIFATVMIAF